MSLLQRVLQALPLGAGARRLQYRLGLYGPEDFRADLRGSLCRIIMPERFVAKLLDIETVPSLALELPQDCVGHVSSRLSEIDDVIDRMEIEPTDEVWDIGSGMGGVAMLIGWLTGARTVGVEFHAELCARASAAARSLGLQQVRFIHADAREVDYRNGNKFYLYMPFVRTVQREVMARLEEVARQRPITIAWNGPRVEMEPYGWLAERGETEPQAALAFHHSHGFSLKIYRSLY